MRLTQTNLQLRLEIDVIRSRSDMEKHVSCSRRLPFHKPVRYRRMGRGELREYILSQMRTQYTPGEFQNYERALQRIGLLPHDMDLMKTVADLYAEQVAAFYDPEKHELFTFDEMSLQGNFERMILAHELVHALQDQNFDFQKLPLRAKTNDDAALAAAALVEGDASHEMLVYLRRNFSVRQILGDVLTLVSQNNEKFFLAPDYLRHMLTFPYQEGTVFVAALRAAGGGAAVDRAFQNPPLSTEQVLHPEKYLAPVPDVPKAVAIDIDAKKSWKKSHENVVGELGIRALFSRTLGTERAEKSALGWGGDRYVVYETGCDRWVLIWKSVWDRSSDAREFFNALEDHYHTRYETGSASPASLEHSGKNHLGKGDSRKNGNPSPQPPSADSVFFSIANQRQNLTIRGDTVFFIDVPDPDTMQILLSKLRLTKK